MYQQKFYVKSVFKKNRFFYLKHKKNSIDFEKIRRSENFSCHAGNLFIYL